MSFSTACQSAAVAGTPLTAGFQLFDGAEYWPDPLRGIVVYLYTVGMTILEAILYVYAGYLFVTWITERQ